MAGGAAPVVSAHRPRRERATVLPLTAYSRFWKQGWCVLFAPKKRGQGLRAMQETRETIAVFGALDARPGAFEIALAHQRSPSRLFVTFIGASGNLQEDVGRIIVDGGDLADFLEQALKENHLVLVRWACTDTAADAAAVADAALDKWDYAWVSQRRQGGGGRARGLRLQYDSYCLCLGCCGGAVRAVEGPPPRAPSAGALSAISSKLLGR